MISVDSHQHFWDPAQLSMPEFPSEAQMLRRAFLPDELAKEMASSGVDYSVCVQAYPQSDDGNRWLFDRANDCSYVAGVVAWLDLTKPSQVNSAIDLLKREPKFVGIRHIVEDEPDLNWIVRENVLDSLKELARRGVPYDMLVRPVHLKNALRVLDEVTDLHVVIDHIAKPEIAAGGSRGWAEDMAAIAQHPGVRCKLSGMTTEANRRTWCVSDISPYVETVIGQFGFERVMFGSDWPVCLLAGGYGRAWDAINDMLSGITSEEREMVFGRTAALFYRLKIPQEDKETRAHRQC